MSLQEQKTTTTTKKTQVFSLIKVYKNIKRLKIKEIIYMTFSVRTHIYIDNAIYS